MLAALEHPNVQAFIYLVSYAEGTYKAPDPYRVCYSFKHTIIDLRDHPVITGEWAGEPLPPEMCRRAGFKSGKCKSTAAGASQFIVGTWRDLKQRLGLPDFGPESQDLATWGLAVSRGADNLILSGDVVKAVMRCSSQWASFPGNYAGQRQRKMDQLVEVFRSAGGTVA